MEAAGDGDGGCTERAGGGDMNPVGYMHSAFSRWFHRDETAQELQEELRSHIAHRADDLQRGGLTRAEAERRAKIEFGSSEHYREETYAELGGSYLQVLMQDVRFAARVLRKTPGFTIAAVLTLALAIGANAVVFSILNAFIIRPLNVANPQRLFGLWRTGANMSESYPDYLDLRDRNHTFDDLVAWNLVETGLDTGGTPSRAFVDEASGNYFDALGVQPYLGRLFHAADEHGPSSAPYLVLTYAYWRTHFKADRGVIGRVVRLDKHPFTIIGVSPPRFNGTLLFFQPDGFVPIVDHAMFGSEELTDRGSRWVFMTLGHLKPGVSKAQAIADLNSIGAGLAKNFPKDDASMKSFTLAQPSMYGDYVGGPVRAFLGGLMLLSGLILLAACANLGGLFAARAADRSREVALRLALGSTRKRILRSLFTEAVLISLAGGAVGLAGGVAALKALSAWQPFSRWPLQLNVNPDARVYAAALLMALASGFLFGAVPVKQVLRTNAYEIIKAGSSARAGKRITTRDALLVVQIALCAVLVTSSLVAVRGLARSLHNDFGFAIENRLLVNADLDMAAYSGDRVPAMQKRMMKEVATIPGVRSVAFADTVPLSEGGNNAQVFTDATTDLSPSKVAAEVDLYKVSPEYFRAAGTSLVIGRDFTWQDNKNAPRVAVVNGEFVRKLFGSAAGAMGRFFKLQDGTRVQVVGIAQDGKYDSPTEEPQAAIFVPILQMPSTSTYLVVQSSGDPLLLANAIRMKLRGLDAALPVLIQTRLQSLDVRLFGPRMATVALGVLGLMGAMLSVTGIFGMAAYSVSKRLKELGIRVALGAQRAEILQAALGRAVKLLAIGSAAGLILGILASHVLAYIVYQATPRDPLVLAGVVLAMAVLGLVATWLPAQRALSVNPLVLLREE